VEVLAPDAASVWVSADLVSNGTVQVQKAYLRAGPGRSYQVVGSAVGSESLDVRESDGGWLRVRPTPACRLWVSRAYVKPVTEIGGTSARQAEPMIAGVPAAVPVQRPSPAADHLSPPVVSNNAAALPSATLHTVDSGAMAGATNVASRILPAPRAAAVAEPRGASDAPSGTLPAHLAKYEMDQDADQGRRALYRGTMDRCNWLFRGPAEYRLLVRSSRRGVVTMCYVVGDSSLLAPLEGKRVAVSGREYRFKRVDRPVIVYDSVLEDSGDTGTLD
jgi:uncharacterized protein YraI